MALINHTKKEINAKIVYYGCEGAGKRTSMQYIYERIKPSLRGELKSFPTSGGSLLFFDFSPFEAFVFGGYRVRFHIYTLPGRVVNPAAWKMTLKGADGLVVVADDSPERVMAGRDSIQHLRDFLSGYGLGVHDLPVVLQLNSFSGIGKMSPDSAAVALDLTGTPLCPSVAVSGEGVLEALATLSRAIMSRVGEDDAFRVREPDPQEEQSLSGNGAPVDEIVETTACDVSGESPVVLPDAGYPVQGSELGEGQERFMVRLAGDTAVSKDGVVRVPLQLTLEGTTRRLVVSISIDQA